MLAVAPVMPAEVPLAEGDLVRLAEVCVQELLGLPALEEAERVGGLEILRPRVLDAPGVPSARLRDLGEAGEHVGPVGRIERERAGDDDHGARVRAITGGAPRGQLVLDQGAALHDGQEPGLVLEDGDVAQGVTVDHEQVGQVALLHRAELVAAAHELGPVPGRPADDVERVDPRLLDVELELVGVAAVGQADGAVVVTAEQPDPGGVGRGQDAERLLDVGRHGRA